MAKDKEIKPGTPPMGEVRRPEDYPDVMEILKQCKYRNAIRGSKFGNGDALIVFEAADVYAEQASREVPGARTACAGAYWRRMK